MTQQAGSGADWWRGCVIYQVYPRSFQDSTGDGSGDLAGITRRLPHIASLGVDAVWLSPFFKSPMADMGYDVSDYCAVDPMFGTLADFDAMISEAHRLGLKIIIDQVLSHSSDKHPWFLESRTSRDNPKADWYVWAQPKPDGTAPNNWLSIFGGPGWEWDSTRKQYYQHNFLASQPDLNFHNPEVQIALLETVRFWLDRGVDGFRLDTVNFYIHDKWLRDNPPLAKSVAGENEEANPYEYQDHLFDKMRPENIAFLERFRALLDEYGNRSSVGEVGDGERSLQTVAAYTSGGDKLHMCYTFDLLGPKFSAAHVHKCIANFEAAVTDGWVCWAFSNHDVIRHVTRWTRPGCDPEAVAKFSIALLACLRDSICIYQGEELGLEEAEAEQGGFSDGKPWLPISAAHRALAVDRQQRDAESVLCRYRVVLEACRTLPALIHGSITLLETECDVLALVREEGAERLLCVFNFSEKAASLPVPARLSGLIPLPFPGALGEFEKDRITLAPLDYFIGRFV